MYVTPALSKCAAQTTANTSAVYYVHVQDVARLHVAGLINPAVNDERIFAYASSYSINEFFDIFAKAVPGHKHQEELAGLDFPLAEIGPRGKAEALLKDMVQPGFAGLEETIISSIRSRINASS